MPTKKKSNPEEAEQPAVVFKEFILTIDPDKPTIVPVVATLDELPRAARRRLRSVMNDSTLERVLSAGPKFQQMVDYAAAYAATQGVRINLDDESLDDDTFDRVRQELLVVGIQLMGHFADAAGDAEEGNAGSPAGDEGQNEPPQN